jgi:serine protease Do
MKKIWMTFIALHFTLIGLADNAIDISEKAIAATVFIASETNYFDQSFGSDPGYYEYFRPIYNMFWPAIVSHASGFIISPEGYIVTNDHAVERATKLLVVAQCGDKRIYKARVIGRDPRIDIAVLKIEDSDNVNFPYLKFGDSSKVKVGEQVLVVGNPVAPQLESTVTMGIVSAIDKNNFGIDLIEGYIQTDATINNGNSGSPLINLNGEVIGVINWCFTHVLFEGLGFAIPSNSAKKIVDQLIKHGKAVQGFLGIECELAIDSVFNRYYFENNQGAQIKKVLKNSPAEKAGLQEGDIILKINEYTVKSIKSLINQIWTCEPNTTVNLVINRSGEIIEISVQLAAASEMAPFSSF